jgi:hypothetical protein
MASKGTGNRRQVASAILQTPNAVLRTAKSLIAVFMGRACGYLTPESSRAAKRLRFGCIVKLLHRSHPV